MWIVLLFSFLASEGCATAKLEASTDPSPAPQTESALVTQTRWFKDAQEYQTQGNVQAATRLLRRLIDTYPDSPLLLEARWALGRASEQSGDLDGAMKEYRAIIEDTDAKSPRGKVFAQRARGRITELERNIGTPLTPPDGTVGILISPTRLPASQGRADWLRGLAKAGFTTLVLEVGMKSTAAHSPPRTQPVEGSNPRQRPAGVYFRTKWARVLDDLLDQIVPLAHEHGLSVFGAVTARHMPWLEPSEKWGDRTFNLSRRTVEDSPALDLFNPGFQEYLSGFLTDLAATGIDGVLFRADAPPGMTDGFSSYGLDGFHSSFGIQLDPAQLFPVAGETVSGHISSGGDIPSESGPGHPPEFWQWTGWKARERLKIFSHLMSAMRQRSPQLQFVLEVHSEAISNPTYALSQFSEDLLEAKRAGFHFVLTRIKGPVIAPTVLPPPGDESDQAREGDTPPSFISRLIELMDGPERVWVTRPSPVLDSAMISQSLSPSMDKARVPKGIGILYMKPLSHVP